VYLFSFIALFCSKGLRYATPMNYIVLFIFTVSMAFMISGLCAFLTPGSVLTSISVLAMILSCLFLSMMCTTNFERALKSVLIGILVCCLLQLSLMIPLCIAGFYGGLWILYCFLGILIASGLIYFDLFIIMMAGKYAMDEYILCALILYLDIIRLFYYILLACGKRG
jgi:protein lifeguard